MGKPLAANQDEPSRRWCAALLAVLLFATHLNYANRFTFTQNAIPIQEFFGANEQQYGEVASLFGLGFACGGLVFGILADTVSIWILYPLVVVIWSLAGFYSAEVESLVGLKACRFVLGLFEAGHWPCALRTTQRVFRPQFRTWGNSILQSGASLGAVLTPQLVLALYVWDPGMWRYAFYIVGAFGPIWAISWFSIVRPSHLRRPVIQTDETSADVGRSEELQEIPFYRVFLTQRWWVLLAVVICINTLWHYVRVWMPLMLEKDHGYDRVFIQNFTSVYYLCTFFGSLVSGAATVVLCRRGCNVHTSRLWVFAVFGLMASFSIPAAFLARGPLLLGSLLIVAFGSLGLFPVYYSLNQEISAKNQGKVGGSLGFSTWLILFFVHQQVGAIVDANPANRPYLMATVGLGPIIAFIVLVACWGRRPTR